MGLIAAGEVPDFFIVRPLVRIGTDANGRPIFKASERGLRFKTSSPRRVRACPTPIIPAAFQHRDRGDRGARANAKR